MSYGSIYKICFQNDKHYIGLTTTSLEQRRREHRKCAMSGSKTMLYNALRKYDMVNNFEIVKIDTAESLEELKAKEIHYIEQYNSFYLNVNGGYNMTKGGDGVNGYICTDEVRKKLSENTKKQFEDPEARRKQSERAKKQFEDPDIRKQMSEKKKKYYEDNPNAGKEGGEKIKKYYEDNPEARKRMSNITTEYYKNNPEARNHTREKMLEYFDNPEIRQKHSELKKKFFENNPNAGKEHSERLKKYYQNPEALQKNSDAQKKYYQENPGAIKKNLDTKGKNKPFDVFKDGIYLRTFSYQMDAKHYLQKEHGITSTIKISEVLNGSRNSSAGFVFKYK
jgi:hypothetical protein